MGKRNYNSQSEHDRVVIASSKTYGSMEANGSKVSINPDGEKNFWVGNESNPRYPDVAVWKPDSPGSNRASAVEVIEEIETEDSVTYAESAQWKDYAGLGIIFRLIVPKDYVNMAVSIINSEGIGVSEIWYYYFENSIIKFGKHK